MPDYTVKADVDTMLRANDKAGIRSAIGVGTTDAPTFLAQTLTGQSLTGTQATSLVDMAATWNTSGTPTAIKLNVVETGINSNAASNLMDLQVGGVSYFRVQKDGATTWRMNTGGTSSVALYAGNTPGVHVTQSTGLKSILTPLGLTFNTNNSPSNPAILTADGADVLAQRNGTAKQALRVYNTALAGAPEWAEFDWITSGGTNTLRIGTNLSGTGAVRGIDFVVGGSRKGGFAINGYFDTLALSVGFISWTGGTGGARIYKGGTDGTFGFYNGAESVSTLLNIATAGYMKVRNIGDTAFNNIQGKLTTDTAYTATVVTPTGFLTLYDSTGTAYRVPCVV